MDLTSNTRSMTCHVNSCVSFGRGYDYCYAKIHLSKFDNVNKIELENKSAKILYNFL